MMHLVTFFSVLVMKVNENNEKKKGFRMARGE